MDPVCRIVIYPVMVGLSVIFEPHCRRNRGTLRHRLALPQNRRCGRKMLSHALSLAQKWSAPPRTADGGAGVRRRNERIMVAPQTVRSLFAFAQLRRDEMAEMSLFNSIGIATLAILSMLQAQP